MPVAVEDAYNLPTVTVQHDQVTSDTHSGYTTNNLNWQELWVGLPNQDPQKMATLAILYSVNPIAYTDAVYPIDSAQPTKIITDTHVV